MTPRRAPDSQTLLRVAAAISFVRRAATEVIADHCESCSL